MEQITLTRTELYDLVWKEPMLLLSKRFTISDTGLRKTCKRLNFPIPQQGHWQKIKFGKKPGQLKLPKEDGVNNIVTLAIRDQEAEAKNQGPTFNSIRDQLKADSSFLATKRENKIPKSQPAKSHIR
jgi:hypothetical protein